MAKINNEHIRFAVLATDVVVFSFNERGLLTRLIKVDRPPFFINSRGLPGGLIDPKETADESAKRIVEKKIGISASKLYVEQLYTFSKIDRDPRGRVIAVAYMAFVPWDKLSKDEQSDTSESWWTPINSVKDLAYDHDEIFSVAINRLRSRITYTTLLVKLLPKEFTLTDFENVYESILGTGLDKRNFRKKILKLDILEPVTGKFLEGKFRPAQLYKFTSTKVKDIQVL